MLHEITEKNLNKTIKIINERIDFYKNAIEPLNIIKNMLEKEKNQTKKITKREIDKINLKLKEKQKTSEWEIIKSNDKYHKKVILINREINLCINEYIHIYGYESIKSAKEETENKIKAVNTKINQMEDKMNNMKYIKENINSFNEHMKKIENEYNKLQEINRTIEYCRNQ